MMKIKIQIKSIIGKVLFEYEKENNTVKETIIEAVKQFKALQSHSSHPPFGMSVFPAPFI